MVISTSARNLDIIPPGPASAAAASRRSPRLSCSLHIAPRRRITMQLEEEDTGGAEKSFGSEVQMYAKTLCSLLEQEKIAYKRAAALNPGGTRPLEPKDFHLNELDVLIDNMDGKYKGLILDFFEQNYPDVPLEQRIRSRIYAGFIPQNTKLHHSSSGVTFDGLLRERRDPPADACVDKNEGLMNNNRDRALLPILSSLLIEAGYFSAEIIFREIKAPPVRRSIQIQDDSKTKKSDQNKVPHLVVFSSTNPKLMSPTPTVYTGHHYQQQEPLVNQVVPLFKARTKANPMVLRNLPSSPRPTKERKIESLPKEEKIQQSKIKKLLRHETSNLTSTKSKKSPRSSATEMYMTAIEGLIKTTGELKGNSRDIISNIVYSDHLSPVLVDERDDNAQNRRSRIDSRQHQKSMKGHTICDQPISAAAQSCREMRRNQFDEGRRLKKKSVGKQNRHQQEQSVSSQDVQSCCDRLYGMSKQKQRLGKERRRRIEAASGIPAPQSFQSRKQAHSSERSKTFAMSSDTQTSSIGQRLYDLSKRKQKDGKRRRRRMQRAIEKAHPSPPPVGTTNTRNFELYHRSLAKFLYENHQEMR